MRPKANQVREYFKEFKESKIEIGTRYLQDGSFFIYKGVLVKKSFDFIYLKNGEVFRVSNDKKEKVGNFRKIALSKSIITWVKFE